MYQNKILRNYNSLYYIQVGIAAQVNKNNCVGTTLLLKSYNTLFIIQSNTINVQYYVYITCLIHFTSIRKTPKSIDRYSTNKKKKKYEYLQYSQLKTPKVYNTTYLYNCITNYLISYYFIRYLLYLLIRWKWISVEKGKAHFWQKRVLLTLCCNTYCKVPIGV